MKFGKRLKKDSNFILKIYFFSGSAFLLVFIVFYSNILLRNTKKDSEILPNLLAKYFSVVGDKNFESHMITYFNDGLIQKIDYPLIITDAEGIPQLWKNVGVSEDISTQYDFLSNLEKDLLINTIKKLPYKIPQLYGDKVFGYVHYGDSKTVKYLRYMPFFEMGLILSFIAFGFYGFILVRRSEKNSLWVGLAKETAHQFGTPLSSLLAWMDLLQMKLMESGDDTMMSWIDNMRADVKHLQKVANRFGKVGSNIKRNPHSIHEMIQQTVDYFDKRLPNLNNKITLHVISKIEGKLALIDADLIRWTLENVLKNSIDAMTQKGGDIIITCFSAKKNISILVKDSGKGIPKSDFNKIFEPGITSKDRGWGLGLSLAKRIIEDYHKGKIRVLESTVGEGTTIEIMLPEE